MAKETEVIEAVEAIARADEAIRLKRSPFHLSPCGGCGAPSFRQPCTLCGYYPMGPDKGTWHPKQASFEDFRRMVETSGPGGDPGTIATWYARAVAWPRTAERSEEVARLVSPIPVPDARTVWDVVTGQGIVVTRDRSHAHVNEGWQGLEEASCLVSGAIGKGAPRLAPEMTAILQDWVRSVHEGDHASMRDALERCGDLCRGLEAAAGKTGNLESARRNIRRALDMLPGSITPTP